MIDRLFQGLEVHELIEKKSSFYSSKEWSQDYTMLLHDVTQSQIYL